MNVVVVDTNVLVTANGRALPPGVTQQCVSACAHRLRTIQVHEVVAVDDDWRILNEYKRNAHERGQPGVGDAFLKWLLSNVANPKRCHAVRITPTADAVTFAEFPADPSLTTFDMSDRKFVAVSRAHPERPAILNATDSDWQTHADGLFRHGVTIVFLCPEYLRRHEHESLPSAQED